VNSLTYDATCRCSTYVRSKTRLLQSAGDLNTLVLQKTRNSSGDEIANVNFLYDDIVHKRQNTIDSCINSATDRRGYVLERRFTKFSEITQCNGHYSVQSHSRSPILVPIEGYIRLPIILTYLLSCTVSMLWLIVGHIFASERRVPHFDALTGSDPCQYRHKWYIAEN